MYCGMTVSIQYRCMKAIKIFFVAVSNFILTAGFHDHGTVFTWMGAAAFCPCTRVFSRFLCRLAASSALPVSGIFTGCSMLSLFKTEGFFTTAACLLLNAIPAVSIENASCILVIVVAYSCSITETSTKSFRRAIKDSTWFWAHEDQ